MVLAIMVTIALIDMAITQMCLYIIIDPLTIIIMAITKDLDIITMGITIIYIQCLCFI